MAARCCDKVWWLRVVQGDVGKAWWLGVVTRCGGCVWFKVMLASCGARCGDKVCCKVMLARCGNKVWWLCEGGKGMVLRQRQQLLKLETSQIRMRIAR